MNLQRKNINQLKPYTCARDLYKKGVFLDANENYKQWVKIDWSKIKNLNRYPDSTADQLRQKLVKKYIKGFEKENIFVGCGSDEIIDLLIRGFVENNESIMVMNPSYSVYQVQADINNSKVKKVLLNPDFSLNIKKIKDNINKVKLLFLCSPNNPTGNLINQTELKKILKFFKGLIVIDEAYIEFAGLKNSLINLVKNNPQLVILRTFSKAWGLAGIRLGYAVANPQIINVLLKIKDSYNASSLSQTIALQALDQLKNLKKSVAKIKSLKASLEKELKTINLEVIPNEANFVLLKIKNAAQIYQKLAGKRIIARDRSNLPYLENVLRITVGSEKENKQLIKTLKRLL